MAAAKPSEDANRNLRAHTQDSSSHLKGRKGRSGSDGANAGESREEQDTPKGLATNLGVPNASTLIALALVAAVLAAVVSSWK